MKGGYEPLDSSAKAEDRLGREEDAGLSKDIATVFAKWQDKSPANLLASSGNILDTLEHKAEQVSRRISRSTKIIICCLIVLSAILSPILLITQSIRSGPLTDNIPATLKHMSWNPSMLPAYPVLDQLRSSGDLSSKLFPTPLGAKVVVLDVDTRPWDLHDTTNLTQISYGRLNHYLYAKMHGYDYKYINAPIIPGEIRQTWVKIDAIRKVLQQGYQFVVFTDYDIVFPHLKIPIEWFLDYWKVTPEIILTVGSVPNRTDKYDQFHRHLSINSGFMVVQNAPQALDMLKDWAECPSEVKFPGCAKWKLTYSHEQNAYADYIRYEYPNTTRIIDCDEVTSSEFMKMPNAKKCRGTLVQHFWAKKDEVKAAVQASIANLVLPEVVRDLQDEVVSHIVW